MAEIKKYLDLVGAEHLVDLVKAEDVKVKEAANAYADSLAKNYDAAGSAATAEANAKAYADGLAVNYDVAGAAAAVQTNLDTEVQARKDGDATLQSSIDGVSAVANQNKADIEAINNTESGILAQAKADATEKANAVQAEVDALEELVGTLPEGTTAKTVVEYVNKKTEGIATDSALAELQGQLSGVQGEVATIKGDYLKGSDKEELSDAIALKADQTALDEVSAVANAAATKSALEEEVNRAKGEEARIEGLVSAEAERAAKVETDLEKRIETMEVFWDTTEDADGVVNKLKEIQDYIDSDETGAATMAGNIQANTQAIADMDTAYKAADATLQGNIDTLSGVVDGKASQADFDVLEGRVEVNEGDIEALEGRMDTAEGKISALEEKFGDGENSVADMIGDAVDAEKAEREAADTAVAEAAAADAQAKADKALEDAKAYADAEDAKIESRVDALEGASATHALKSEVEAVAGRVTTIEGKVSTLESEMDAVEKKASDNESAIGDINAALDKKATQADLEAAVARIAKNEGDISNLNTTMETKADADDVEAIEERVTANEGEIASLKSAVNSFVRIENSEIDALFA